MASLRFGLMGIFKWLLVFNILAYAGVAAASRVPIATHQAIVKQGETYDGIQYPIGTIVHLTDIGNEVGDVLLSQDFKMNGHVIKKGTHLHVPNGKLSCYWSLQGQAIGVIVLKKEAQVCFDKNGALAQIHLRHANEILGNPYAANSWVHFHPNGKVAKGALARDVKRVGLALAGGSTITFYPSGSINSAAIKSGANFGELRLSKRQGYESDVSFWPNGRLQDAVLTQPVAVAGTNCAPGDISFKKSGDLKHCVILKTGQQLAADAAQKKLATIADANLVRASLKTPGVVSLIAGSLGHEIGTPNASTDGVGSEARFDRPVALAVDSAGNLFLTESGANRRIRKISAGGVVTTIAGIAGNKGHGYQDGPAASARFGDLAGIAIDKEGALYIADTGNSAIRKISVKGVVSTIAGNATHSSPVGEPRQGTTLQFPAALAFDRAGRLHVSNVTGRWLRRIDSTGAITPSIGHVGGLSMDGSVKTARFTSIDSMAFDKAGNLFIGDMKLLRKISSAGTVSTLGNYADAYSEVIFTPEVLLVDPVGNLYFAVNSTIRKLTPGGILSTVAGVAGQKGNELGVTGLLHNPRGLVMLGPKTFAFISGNAVLKLALP